MISQIAIAFTGVVAVWLTQSVDVNKRKWACIFGLIGQPFWFYSCFIAQQWGMFVLCFFYLFAWCKGFYIHWIKK